jgi:hypothetical protein
MVFPRTASRGTELIPRPKPQFGDPGDRYTIGGPLFLGLVFQNPQVVTVECESEGDRS